MLLMVLGGGSVLSETLAFFRAEPLDLSKLWFSKLIAAIGLYLFFKRDKQPVDITKNNWVPPAPPPPVVPPPPVAPSLPPPSFESVVHVIVDESNEPLDERIRKLNNLRYERLITDEEFHAAKAKILGI